MAESKTVTQLVDDINDRLADNNAGQISAKDVRETMRNVAHSIPFVVASGDWDVQGKEFISDVRLRTHDSGSGDEGGTLIVQSGVVFENGNPDGVLAQTRPYLGPTGINHGELLNLTGTSNDHHTQYLLVAGTRSMAGDLGMGDNFIKHHNDGNSYSGHGIRFEHVDANEEILHVGDETSIQFDVDGTKMTTARSNAQAWVNFNSVSGVGESNTLIVNSSYNVSSVKRVTENGVPQAGKFRVYFNAGTFDNPSGICAIGTSNARSSNASGGDFDQNTVSCVVRNSNYVTFYVQDDTNAFRDAEVNDLMVFGNPSGVIPADTVTVGYVAE